MDQPDRVAPGVFDRGGHDGAADVGRGRVRGGALVDEAGDFARDVLDAPIGEQVRGLFPGRAAGIKSAKKIGNAQPAGPCALAALSGP
jgi:hypothetical protein